MGGASDSLGLGGRVGEWEREREKDRCIDRGGGEEEDEAADGGNSDGGAAASGENVRGSDQKKPPPARRVRASVGQVMSLNG
jgi:hypothetical protein